MVMTNEEISRDYRLAKDKKGQVTRLAELNDCEKSEILNVLIECGEISGAKKAKTQKNAKFSPEEKAEIVKLANEGVPSGEIAERLGYDKQQIYSLLCYCRKQQNNNKIAVPEINQTAESTTEHDAEGHSYLDPDDILFALRIALKCFSDLVMLIKWHSLFRQFTGDKCVNELFAASEDLGNICEEYINMLDNIAQK